MSEEAKAKQEIARAVNNGIEASRELGRFVARIVGGPLDQVAGIVEDRLRLYRWERQLRYRDRVRQLLKERGMDTFTQSVPMSFVVPVLEAASIEENDELQDLWAQLLVNAGDASSRTQPHRMYVSILKDLTPMDALVLKTLYDASGGVVGKELWTTELPDRVLPEKPATDENLRPAPEVELSLANLKRLGCIESATTWGGVAIFSVVQMTQLGLAFVEACIGSKTIDTDGTRPRA